MLWIRYQCPLRSVAPSRRGSLRYAALSEQSKRDRLRERAPQRSIIWLSTIGIFLPYTFGTTGKYIIVPLSLLAVFRFFSHRDRRVVACDFFIWAAVIWMVVAEIGSAGYLSQQTGSDAVAFAGSYMVARTFIFGERSIQEFIRVFKVVTIVLIALSMLDTISGRFLTNTTMATIFQAPSLVPAMKGQQDLHRQLFGVDVIRAAATFPHPILYGTFCTIAGTIFLYSERRFAQRAFYVGICLLGGLLSISSGPLLAFMIAIITYCYDYLLRRESWRWIALGIFAACLVCAVFLVSNNPLGFILSHFTFKPETGYYRLLIWQDAFRFIENAPLAGSISNWMSDDILADSVDCVWLVLALAHGLPVVVFLALATVTAGGGLGGKYRAALLGNADIKQMRAGFSLALAMFAFVGLTVHFWDAIWMFWAFCFGIRASLEEYCVSASRVRAHRRTMQAVV